MEPLRPKGKGALMADAIFGGYLAKRLQRELKGFFCCHDDRQVEQSCKLQTKLEDRIFPGPVQVLGGSADIASPNTGYSNKLANALLLVAISPW